jgi:dipicolinate synthase subunit A
VLIVGYGRIGRIWPPGCRAWLRRDRVGPEVRGHGLVPAFGLETLDTRALEGHSGTLTWCEHRAGPVLGEDRLRELRPGLCAWIWPPNPGVDFAAAASLGVQAVWALSLPGEVAPVSAGEIIRDTVYNILREQELI